MPLDRGRSAFKVSGATVFYRRGGWETMREGETLPPKRGSRTVVISFKAPKSLLQAVDELVEMGFFNSRSEVIRTAIFNLLREVERERRARLEVGYR
jgi:hypothetical protein